MLRVQILGGGGGGGGGVLLYYCINITFHIREQQTKFLGG